ncbi:hypothetical protein L249_5313 [Ophiocordyceps polyrhachis-furcata BCC 54312]|uniref:Nuclear condensin complex subunit 3 C-terminal domain-containing protein n=1 Tax=Ophiocordyceps polyrhachis-furcata BCC 54312 TaxID=1330021 RepID=A0A367L950_9HYPO|nr:hypothetical protein L249_5313 [Ophiocordyceps polyrhachis-furcata BCC 54312]
MPPRASTRKPSAAASKKPAKAPAIEYHDRPNSRLRAQICAIFRDAQRTTATHRKLAINLRKVHEACCYEPKSRNKRSEDVDEDEEAFNHEFVRCVLRIMPVKKAEGVGERAIRFVGSFLRHADDKDLEALGEVDVEASLMPETPSTRLLSNLLEAVFPLMTAKDKFVRFRSTQLVSHVINSLDAIDDDLFQKLRHGLLKRIRDKEAMVRAQAVLGLGRIAGNQAEGCTDSEDSDGGDEEATDLLGKLLQVIQNDPSAEVRRSLLINLPILTHTLPRLLERARDLDPATRRAVYSRLLPALGDFRHLSLSMREKLLRWGLRDRDENVRKAAGRLFRDRWIADCAGTAEKDEHQEEAAAAAAAAAAEAAPSFEGLLELLERIDVVNSGVDNGIALEAMKDFWQGRPDYREAVTLDDAFWETLSAESVFMARSFNDYCLYEDDGRHAALVEEKMPEVTKLAFYLERYMQVLLETLQKDDDNQDDEDTVEQEFIVEQLLHIALTLDYSDEVGRRKMFTLLRQALSKSELPDEVTKLTVEALRCICAPDAAGEREFCSVVIESVADVHDTIVEADEEEGEDGDGEDKEEESFHSARSEVSGSEELKKEKKGKGNKRVRSDSQSSEDEAREKAVREIVVNLKCLHIVRCMLSHVSGNLKDKPDLVSTLNNLIVPAVRSHEAPVRERGLVCLGLCALLDRSLAEENLSLFIHFFTKGHAALQVTALHILTDILNVHGAQLLSATPALLKVYVKAVKGAKVPEVQAVAALATSKLLLGRVVAAEDACEELLKALVVAYFDPASASNQTVRQALNYFLPVFCYSRPANQQLMRAVALQALHYLLTLRQGLEDDDVDVDEDMVSMTTIGACLVDWTDPRKCYSSPPSVHQSDAADKKQPVNGDVHLDFARDILERLRTNISKEEKKLTASLLGKLHVSPGSSEDTVRQLYAQVSDAVNDGLLSDATSRNALYKLHVSLGKVVNGLDEQQPLDRRTSRSISVIPDRQPAEDKTIVEEPEIKEEEDEDEVDKTTAQVTRDSLLSDGEDVEMQDV